MTARAHYRVAVKYEDVIVLFELGGPYPTITNDAEAVVEDLVREHDLRWPMRVVYRDSMGVFDELCIDRDGRFNGFGPIGTHDIDRALAFVRERMERSLKLPSWLEELAQKWEEESSTGRQCAEDLRNTWREAHRG